MVKKKTPGTKIKPVSLKPTELSKYENHASKLGFSFSRLTKIFFDEDIERLNSIQTEEDQLKWETLQESRLEKVDFKPYCKRPSSK